MNTRVTLRSAQPSQVGQFSVGANSCDGKGVQVRHGDTAYMPWPEQYHARQPRPVPANRAPAPRLSPSPARGTSFEPEIARAFGTVTRQTRVDLGVAQDQMALIAGVDRSYFGKLERGERQPSLSILLRIAAALGVSGAELVKRTEAAMTKPKGRVRDK